MENKTPEETVEGLNKGTASLTQIIHIQFCLNESRRFMLLSQYMANQALTLIQELPKDLREEASGLERELESLNNINSKADIGYK